MNSQERADYAEKFESIANKILSLACELTDNKGIKEFLKEMEEHKKDLEIAIEVFRKHA